jgi:putative Mg2+ transporter-C (MgtC) family protein
MNSPWIRWLTDSFPLLTQPTFPRLLAATILGSIIGAERQWRQRAAGLRTATLVCFGSAAFVDLGSMVANPNSTSIIAYVVSGVGFLGAGAIMKEGGSIRGLNTAATLWCSAAVGCFAGAGQILNAAFVTVLLVTINLALRPLSRWIDWRSTVSIHGAGVYRLMVACAREEEQIVSGIVLRAIASRPVTLRELRTEEIEGADESLIEAVVESSKRDKALMTALVTELKANTHVVGVEWAELNREPD